MLLTSWVYFVFLVAVFILYWPVARLRSLGLAVILFANLFFYAKWDLFYLWATPAAAAADFFLALGMGKIRAPWVRRILVSVSILMNLSLLASVKYLPFLRENFQSITGRTAPGWNWVLPLGLSFYCFQALTYTIDVYRRDLKPTSSLLSYLASVTFFPTTLAGPITRPGQLLPQLEKTERRLEPDDSGRAFFLIGLGLAKKFLIADYLGANLVDRVFDTPALYSSLESAVAVAAYAFQIYYDFSGYTDIALGSALLLSLRLPQNFKRPYTALNLADFWRRWHISLSNWLRDYLYFSLPAKRTRLGPYGNLVVTMTLGGLWHGASWNFAVWGLLHGVGLAVVRGWQALRRSPEHRSHWISQVAARAATFLFVCATWVFFRAESWDGALQVFARIGSGTPGAGNLTWPLLMVLGAAVLFHYLPESWYEWSARCYARAPFFVQAALLALLALGLKNVVSTGAAPFIYQRF